MRKESDWQLRQIELLSQLNSICLDNDIPLFLAGETALSVCRDGILPFQPTVAVDSSNVYRLIDVLYRELELDANGQNFDNHRAVEGMFNNDVYPLFELRFCDTSTTDFNVSNFRNYNNNCVHIEIKIIEHIPTDKSEYRKIRWAYNEYKQRVSTDALSDAKKAAREQAGSIYGRMKYLAKSVLSGRSKTPPDSSGIFRKMIETASAASENVVVAGINTASRYFEKTTPIILNIDKSEFEVFLPSDNGEYLSDAFGSDWQGHRNKVLVENNGRFLSTAFSWIEYKDSINDIDFTEYDKDSEEYARISREFTKQHKVVSSGYNILERTFDRFQMYKSLFTRKDELRALLKEENYDALHTALDEYIKCMEKHSERGLGLCFDVDILDITCSLLEHDGRSDLVEKERSLIPEQHLKPLRIKDYRGNYIE